MQRHPMIQSKYMVAHLLTSVKFIHFRHPNRRCIMTSQQPSSDILTDARRPGWFWMDDDIIDRYGRILGTTGIAVYAYLARRADPNGVSFPSYSTIARDLAISRKTAIIYIKKLQDLGLLVVQRRNGRRRSSNIYQLVNIRGRAPLPAAPAVSPPPDEQGAEADPEPITLPLAASTGEMSTPVQQLHQSPEARTGVTMTPVQEIHPSEPDFTGEMRLPVQSGDQGGELSTPGVVNSVHQGGVISSPEGNTHKETQKKETQMKEKEDLASRATRVAGPDDPSPLHSSQKNPSFGFLGLESRKAPETANPPVHDAGSIEDVAVFEHEVEAEQPDAFDKMLDALAQVTGKNLAFLRPQKREQFQIAAQKLLDYGFTPEDVRDFGQYWREGHPIGSNKLNAGRPHLSQVLEDLPASRDWNQQRRQEEAEKADEYIPTLIIHGDEPLEEILDAAPIIQSVPEAPQSAPKPSEAHAVWNRLREELRMRLFGNPALRALERARVLGLKDHRLTVLMPDDASADIWRKRMQIPLERAIIQAFTEPLSVLFLGPTEMAMFTQ
ncbi:MAG TPA: helix-turn-helix domain-containing protein [Anaerolineae bacterium]|nr:helix-turn-helix domain-containing protein [Anaerolineae bacterium]